MNIHELNYKIIKKETYERNKKEANIRDEFYEMNNYVIHQLLKHDLQKYGISSEDIENKQLFSLDYFVRVFLQKINNVYDTTPIINIEGNAKDKERLKDLLDEVNIENIFNSNLEKVKLHNTIINQIKYIESLDQIIIDNSLNIGNSYIYGNDLEWYILLYETLINDELVWVVWDKELKEHYIILTDDDIPRFLKRKSQRIEGEMHLINKDIKAPDYNPFVVYRYDLQNDFWGNGNNALIDLVRLVNVLLTITSDDSVRQTMRILFMNGNPQGITDSNGKLKTGMNNPLIPPADFIGDRNDFKVQVTQAVLYNTDILLLVENLTGLISQMHNVENPIKKQLESNISGIALQLKKEPLMRDWQRDITRMRHYDKKLIKQLIEVHNYYSTDLINENATVSIDYQTPKMVIDEKADYELERMKWEDGTSTPLEYMQKQNPELDEKECIAKLNKNKKITEELFGLKVGLEVE